MAISRGATVSTYTRSATGTTASVSHTVDTSTTLLLFATYYEYNKGETGTPQWSLGGGENLTLIHASEGTDVYDTSVSIWGLVNPTTGAGTVTSTHSSNDCAASVAVNYLGTDTTSVAAATNYLNEDINVFPGDTNVGVHASAGTAGRTAVIVGCGKGGDLYPASNNASFGEAADIQTGTGGANDLAVYFADKIAGAPTAVTITYNGTDSNTSMMLEIVPAAATSIPQGIQGITRGFNPQRSTRLGGELE